MVGEYEIPASGGARVCVSWTSRRSSLRVGNSSNIPVFHRSSIPVFQYSTSAQIDATILKEYCILIKALCII